MPDNDYTVGKYDRIRGGLQDSNEVLFTKPSTIRNIQAITGKAETFVIETARHGELGDYVFIECVDDTGVIRLCLPPKAANAIASQRDALTTRRRSLAGKANAQARKDRGEQPGFMKHKKGGKHTG